MAEATRTRLTRGAISLAAGIGLLVFAPWNQATFPTAQAISPSSESSSDDSILSHHTEYEFRVDDGVVRVEEIVSYDHGEHDDGPARMTLPGYVEHEDIKYELSYSGWMAGNENAENSGISTNPIRTVLTLGGDEGPTTGVVEYKISYALDNHFIQVQEDDVRVHLYPANGWGEMNVEQSTVTVKGLPPESNILCEEDCQYDPQEGVVNLSSQGGPMRLTVYFPQEAGVVGNQKELTTPLPQDSTAPGASSPQSNETTFAEPDEMSIIDRLSSIPQEDMMVVGGIIGGGILILVFSRLVFWRRNKTKKN